MSVRRFLLAHDFHVHTRFSPCARPEMTVARIVRRAERLGYVALGIADHLTRHEAIKGLRATRRRLAQIQTPLRLSLGCEMAVDLAGRPAVSPDATAFLDYIMVGADHVTARTADPETAPREWLRGLLRRWEALIAGDARVDVLAHPLRTLRRHYNGKPLMAHVPDARWAELLAGLAARGIAIELQETIENHESCFDEVRAFYRIALAQGVRFSPASDAHGLDRLGFMCNWVRLAEELNLRRADFWTPKNAVPPSAPAP